MTDTEIKTPEAYKMIENVEDIRERFATVQIKMNLSISMIARKTELSLITITRFLKNQCKPAQVTMSKILSFVEKHERILEDRKKVS